MTELTIERRATDEFRVMENGESLCRCWSIEDAERILLALVRTGPRDLRFQMTPINTQAKGNQP